MTITVSMWLGILFLTLAVVAVLLQAWLWGPRFWDEAAKKTRAPRLWLRIHALCGYAYAGIYVVMMSQMFPRLWEYQYELPTRTVVHAVAGILIGVLLISKISILLFFRHFEESMPSYGFGILVCTVVLSALSVPYALRAHDLGGRTQDPENLARVRRLLGDLSELGPTPVGTLTSERGLAQGREILVSKCTPCHDMRTILTKPRTAKGWFDVSERMLEKPSVFGAPLEADDIAFVTAYLTAITPEIQESVKRRRADEREASREQAGMVALAQAGDPAVIPAIDRSTGDALLRTHCTECHELDELDGHGGDDLAGWRSVVAAMVAEGADYDEITGGQIAAYLAQERPPAPGITPVLPPPRQPSPGVATAPAQVEPTTVKPKDDAPAQVEGPKVVAGPKVAADPTPGPDAGAGNKGEPRPTGPALKKPRPQVSAPPPAERPSQGATPAGDETAAGSAAAGRGARQPSPSSDRGPAEPITDAAAGQALFLTKCKTCHGADGSGQTPFGQKLEVPSLVHTSRSPAALLRIISAGVPGTKMKGYEDRLSPTQLEDLVAFVRRL